MPPLSRLIRGFRNNYDWFPLGRINASGIEDDRAGLRGYVQFNKYTHTRTHTSPLGRVNIITRMAWPDCAVMSNVIQRFSIHVDRGYRLLIIETIMEAEREAQGARGLNKNSRESLSSLTRLIRGFVTSIIDSPLRGPMRVA